jgi:hypothetical protein
MRARSSVDRVLWSTSFARSRSPWAKASAASIGSVVGAFGSGAHGDLLSAA